MRLTVLSSGPHTSAALHALVGRLANSDTPFTNVICVTNSALDISVAGLRFSPSTDDTVAALTSDERSGDPTYTVLGGLRAAGLAPVGDWPCLHDDAVAAAVARVYRYARGESPTDAARAQLDAAGAPGDDVGVVPLTDAPVELHVVEEDESGARAGRHALRWMADPARRDPESVVVVGLDRASTSSAALEGLRDRDVVVLTPMNPVLDAAAYLAASGVRDALRGTSARVVALSPFALSTQQDLAIEAATWRLAGSRPCAASLAAMYADFLDVLIIDVDEPADTYPASLSVVRAPLRAAFDGDPSATRALRDVIAGDPGDVAS